MHMNGMIVDFLMLTNQLKLIYLQTHNNVYEEFYYTMNSYLDKIFRVSVGKKGPFEKLNIQITVYSVEDMKLENFTDTIEKFLSKTAYQYIEETDVEIDKLLLDLQTEFYLFKAKLNAKA